MAPETYSLAECPPMLNLVQDRKSPQPAEHGQSDGVPVQAFFSHAEHTHALPASSKSLMYDGVGLKREDWDATI